MAMAIDPSSSAKKVDWEAAKEADSLAPSEAKLLGDLLK
jgi:hypothetical protein